MPEIIFSGPAGRLEGRCHLQPKRDAPLVVVFHPHPQFGGTMNNRVVYKLYYTFFNMGFSTLRFNFRGVGRSQGKFDQGIGELADATAALDYLQGLSPNSKSCWIVGFSFGAWIGMQLLMRRPEIVGFISVAPPVNMYDFNFLAPCPVSGLIVSGETDRLVPSKEVGQLAERLNTKEDVAISHKQIAQAGHFFEQDTMEEMLTAVENYVNTRITESTKGKI